MSCAQCDDDGDNDGDGDDDDNDEAAAAFADDDDDNEGDDSAAADDDDAAAVVDDGDDDDANDDVDDDDDDDGMTGVAPLSSAEGSPRASRLDLQPRLLGPPSAIPPFSSWKENQINKPQFTFCIQKKIKF